MSASSSTTTVTGEVVVVTQVHRPVRHVLPPPPPPPGTTSLNPADDYTFNRGRPLVFGTVQILVGLVILVLCGRLLAAHSDKLVVSSGMFVWGPLMSITAGSLTVAAGASLSSSLIKSAVGFNVVAAVTSVVATIILFVDTSGVSQSSFPDKDMLQTVSTGFSAVLSFLEFGLSMQVAASGCRGSCEPRAELFTVTNQLYGTASVTEEAPPAATAPPPPYEKPPEYRSIVEDDNDPHLQHRHSGYIITSS